MSACPFCGQEIPASRGEELVVALSQAKEYGAHMVGIALRNDLPEEESASLLHFGQAILRVVASFPEASE